MAERQFIIFRLEEESFCADVSEVRSINDVTELSKVPGSVNYIEGLLNLRGEVIPVVNLKKRFSLTENVKSQRIIISRKGIGFLVDDASKSMSKDETDILAPPELGVGDNSSYISSIVIHEERLILVINLETVVAEDEIRKMIQ